MEKTIEIPEGYEARIEDNKVILEPKEREDERIGKALILYIKFKGSGILGWRREELIAWLEKQCEHIKFLESIQIGDEVIRNTDGVLVNLSQIKRVAEQGSQKNINNENKMGTVEPIYNDGELHIKDETLAFIYGAIKKYGNNEKLYDKLRGYIKILVR